MPLLSGARYFRGDVSFGTLRYLCCQKKPRKTGIPQTRKKVEEGRDGNHQYWQTAHVHFYRAIYTCNLSSNLNTLPSISSLHITGI